MTSHWSFRKTLGAALFYALCILVAFFPFFFQGKTFLSTDLYLMLYKPFSSGFPQFNPFNHFDEDILKFCYLYQWGAQNYLYSPYWISEIFGGIPQYANTYASHFSTLNWLLKFGPLHIMYPLKLLVTLWIAGINMFIFTRFLKFSMAGALLSGLCYMFSSLFITMLLRWWIPGAFAWVPLILMFIFIAVVKEKKEAWPLASLFLAFSFLDGFFQTSFSICLLVFIFMIFLGWQQNNTKGVLDSFICFLKILILSLGLASIALLPQLEYFWLDITKGSTRTVGNVFGKTLLERLLSLPLLISGYFPQLLGSVRTLDITKLIRTHLQDFSFFIGTLPFLFFLSTWKLKKNIFISSLWLVALLGLAIPILTPLDSFVYFRFLAVYIVGAAALAGYGFDKLLISDEISLISKKVVKIFLGITFLVFVFSFILKIIHILKPTVIENPIQSYITNNFWKSTTGARNFDWMMQRGKDFVSYWSLSSYEFNIALLFVCFSLLLLYFYLVKKITKKIFIYGTFLFTFFQLTLFIHQWLPFNSLEKFPLFPENEITAFGKSASITFGNRFLVDDYNRTSPTEKLIVPSNTNFFFNYSTLEGFDGVRPKVIYDLCALPNFCDGQKKYSNLGLLNVKYIITNSTPRLINPNLKLKHSATISIYENTLAKNRGLIFYSYKAASDIEATKELGLNGLNNSFVFINKTPHFESNLKLPQSEPAELVKMNRNFSNYKAMASDAALFVASETFYPGWKAYVNGQPKEILKANTIMRAVEIPKGESLIEFRFEPDIFKKGLLISILSFVFLISYFLWATRRIFFPKIFLNK